MASRPRHSVLSLFDPLAHSDAPCTPPRDSASPDSDKENSSPTLSLSAFFNRTYKQPCPAVVLPRKRLVDVGDITLDDVSALDQPAKEHGQSPQDEPALSRPKTPVASLQPRTPLAELALRDVNSTSLPRIKSHPHQPNTPSLLTYATPNDELSTGHDSPIHRMSDMVVGNADNTTNESHAPEIIVSSSHPVDNSPDNLARHNLESDIARDADLPSSPSFDAVQAESSLQGIAHSTLRLQPPSTAAYSNRISIDLQASFQLHFQSDASFDLLNDKISLTEPMEYLVPDDENFDFEVEKDKLRDALAKFKKGLTPSKISASHDSTVNCDPLSQEDSNSAQACLDSRAPPRDEPQPLPYFSSLTQDDKISKRQSVPSKLLSPTSHRGTKSTVPVASEEATSSIPQAKQRRMSIPIATPRRLPSIAPPPAVQALRIVKRAKIHCPKSESASGVIPGASTNVTSSMTNKQERLQASSKQATAEGITHALTRALRRESSVGQQIAPSADSIRTDHGPRRVAVADNPVGRTTTKSNQMSLHVSTIGPRRIPINNAGSTVILSKSSSITTGLKQPTRLESGQFTTSGLPRAGVRAGSRLPAPTAGPLGTSKLRKPTGGLPKRVVLGE